jgi:hypothetical protein
MLKNYDVEECSLTDRQRSLLRDAYESGDWSQYVRVTEKQENALMSVLVALALSALAGTMAFVIYLTVVAVYA